MAQHLMLRLASPLIAFGGESIDNQGVIRDFPALSMLTGLIANALGWDRGDDALHNRLQQRLRMGTVLEPMARSADTAMSTRLVDFQTAELGAADTAWTTWGQPEERRGGLGSYAGPHLRYRHYHAEVTAWVALQLAPCDEAPTLDAIASALDRPMRPLFIGRKPCLPAGRLVAGWQEAEHVLGALQAWSRRLPANAQGWRAQWPDGQGALPSDRRSDLCDERNWTSGLHGGWRPVREGRLRAEAAA
ncbi:type I-E CRISPR-associated protein Cas5/CasD [Verminephrobacter aporrectodeae]|uniref:type I-E CRISPR-associated protein Cas5/CasD n=1 Tax=Verminephrobacter aporrectodeae TaxID=1110389 RepID=UPI0022432540|nr:type I-E CRISPR-associated protein Cas5/CasD [Verminephrobacter aporrectodeae]MCW8176684.1 type I-E CRISPR-associated protein Cas5/CasD [Verminephrobacter aporrectodeae subsp. tuberculatae]MCW8204329.1 type I-E CRISPR-associated protein Cas5/CasD [Verminephrobacter aporrectodeae subsp. tuberculatae]